MGINRQMETMEKATNIDINNIIDLAEKAGQAILAIYNTETTISTKEDGSPLTQADLASHNLICAELTEQYPDIPIISEESNQTGIKDISTNHDYFWLIDPLDGTKEFINRNGEFTVNIALIYKGRPILGVIHAPVLEVTYFAEKGNGCFKKDKEGTHKLPSTKLDTDSLVVVASKSHLNDATKNYIEQLEEETGKYAEKISVGSSLKFCLVAEGKAHVYPRLAPTMHWDTAAGDIIACEAGKTVINYETSKPLDYSDTNKLNPWFVVK